MVNAVSQENFLNSNTLCISFHHYIEYLQCTTYLSGLTNYSKTHVSQESIHEIESVVGESVGTESVPQHIVGMLGEGHLLHSWQVTVLGPDLLARSPQVFEDAVELVDLRPTGEKRLHQQQFGEDAADRPHVDLGRVLLRAE